MVVRDIERDEIELISKTLGCLPIAHVDNMKPEKLGAAKLVEEVEVRGMTGMRLLPWRHVIAECRQLVLRPMCCHEAQYEGVHRVSTVC